MVRKVENTFVPAVLCEYEARGRLHGDVHKHSRHNAFKNIVQ
jgi:hypothetical protein